MLALRVKGDLGDFNITREGDGLWGGKRERGLSSTSLNAADKMLPYVLR